MTEGNVSVSVSYTGTRDTVTMSVSRTQSDTVGHGQPIVFVSSRDESPAPTVAGARKLAETARSAGWAEETTYAAAYVPAQHYLNGNPAKPAHWLESVVVRLRRGPTRGYAAWRREGGGSWRFAHAFIGVTRFGWSTAAKTKIPSILKAVAA